MNIRNANKRYILNIEQRSRSISPIITADVNNDSFYALASIDSTDTFIEWYVKDIHGFDLLRGYDNYKSDSGNTVYEWRVPLNDRVGKIVLMEQNSNDVPSVRRYEHINRDTILEEVTIRYEEEQENETFSPSWQRNFSSLSRSSVF